LAYKELFGNWVLELEIFPRYQKACLMPEGGNTHQSLDSDIEEAVLLTVAIVKADSLHPI